MSYGDPMDERRERADAERDDWQHEQDRIDRANEKAGGELPPPSLDQLADKAMESIIGRALGEGIGKALDKWRAA